MSRIGKKPIEIPEHVDVNIENGSVLAKGPKGELSLAIHQSAEVAQTDNVLNVKLKREGDDPALWGLTRALVFNMIHGVSEGYSKVLEVSGVGYRAQVQGKKLVLSLGFSHPVEFQVPENIDIKIEGNAIEISGADKQLVGQVAANIRAFKKPEPYKGKGIHYQGERIRRKAGKKVAA